MKKYCFFMLFFFHILACFFLFPQKAYAANPFVIVLDPGHGGENLGANPEGYLEKEITLALANSMYEELGKYDGVKVYMTRDKDKDMSLAERAEFAASVQADMLISLHFNMSENHTLFGSEVWVSAFDEYYKQGAELGEAVLDELEALGTYRKGVKTRLNDEGTDYYGIIRESRDRGIPAIIIEHCYLDHENDAAFRSSEESYRTFGRLDATATAKYLHLSSETLGADYSTYVGAWVEVPLSVVRPDLTPPDICFLELVEADKEERTLKLRLSAQDSDSGMLYYSYSLDGGITFSTLREWPEADTFQFVVDVPNGMNPHVVVNAYNKYDICAESNAISVEGFPLVTKTEEETAVEALKNNVEQNPSNPAANNPVSNTLQEVDLTAEKDVDEADRSFFAFLKISGICIGILFILLLIGYSYLTHKKKKRRRKF